MGSRLPLQFLPGISKLVDRRDVPPKTAHNVPNICLRSRLDGANVRRGVIIRPSLGQSGREIGVGRQEDLGTGRQTWSKQGREVGEALRRCCNAEDRLQERSAGDHGSE